MLTSRLPSETGVYDNASELAAGQPTIAHLLRASGYRTALAGKMHFIGPDQLHGFEQRLTTDVYPSDFEWTPDWTLPPDERLAWYHNMASLRQTRVTEAAMQTDYDDEVGVRGRPPPARHRPARRRPPFFLTVSFSVPARPLGGEARALGSLRRCGHRPPHGGRDSARPGRPPQHPPAGTCTRPTRIR